MTQQPIPTPTKGGTPPSAPDVAGSPWLTPAPPEEPPTPPVEPV